MPTETSSADLSFNHVAVLGAGSWGTALAVLLASRAQHLPEAEAPRITLVTRREEHARAMRETRENADYLPGISLPEGLEITHESAVLGDCELVALVTPSKAMRATLEGLAAAGRVSPEAVLVSCTKGMEIGTGLRMSQLIAEHMPQNPIAVLTGPAHAEEVASGAPAAVVVGSESPVVAQQMQQFFTGKNFRAYRNEDMLGMELGGALKNIYAIGAGISDGLGLGDNAKAAMVTRGLAEMVRFGTQLGGLKATFNGLSGIGDLMVTCFSKHSRNRSFGERVGRGESLKEIRESMSMVAEGVPTTKSVYETARKLQADTPVIDQIYAILYEDLPPREAIGRLMDRDPKHEFH